ncbi:MAG TPA: TonB-dependent receptor [Enhygromyxa sp.]|nr:TonB-dependent receptor [Enhygromyxa sp.]
MLGSLVLLGSVMLGPPAEPASEPEAEPVAVETIERGTVRIAVGVRGRRDAVAGATVLVLTEDDSSEPIRVETDARGLAELELDPGVHRFSIRADGYEPRELELEVVAGELVSAELRLDETLGGHRYRTVVESERPVAITRTTLRDEAIHEVPGSGGDPFAVVRSLPGAAQVAGFLPYVVVRGAAPGNTGYYLDGIRVPALFHVAVGPSVVHPYFIDEVDFYAGGVPVRLGRFASGIVEGRTRTAARDRVRGEIDLRLTDTGALVEIPFNRPRDRECLRAAEALDARARRKAKPACLGPGRGALTLGGRYSYTGLILSAIPGLNVKLRYWDYQARLDHDLGRNARYTAFVFGSYDELGPKQAITDVEDQDGDVTQVLDRDPDPYVHLEFHRIDQRIRQRLGSRGHIDYRLALGLDRSGVQGLRVDEWRVVPRIDAQLELGERLTLHAGLDQEFQIFKLPRGIDTSTLTDSVEDLALLLSERFVSVTGLYVDLAYRRGALEIRPGVRADLWAQVGVSPYLPAARTRVSAFGVDPRLLLREQVGEHIALRQSVGVYHQAPDPPIPIPGVETIGLEDGLQRNTQGSFGWEWTIAERVVLTQDAYVGRLANMQDYELSEGLDDSGEASTADEFDDYLIRVTGWAWGLETMLRLIPDGKAYGWLAYTLSWSIRDYPLGGYAPATWDQRHILNAVVGWNINRKWRLGGRMHVNSGRPYTSRRVDAQGNLESLIDALTEHRNDARLPAFMQLDLRVERVFTLRDARLHLYLDLANANFAREVLRCDSLSDSADPSVQIVDGCVNPQAVRYILPALGLRATF